MRQTCSRISFYLKKPWLPYNHAEAVLYNPSVCTISRSNSLITTVLFILRGTCRIRPGKTLSTKITSKSRPKPKVRTHQKVGAVLIKSNKNKDSLIQIFLLKQRTQFSANLSIMAKVLTTIKHLNLLMSRKRNRYSFLSRDRQSLLL